MRSFPSGGAKGRGEKGRGGARGGGACAASAGAQVRRCAGSARSPVGASGRLPPGQAALRTQRPGLRQAAPVSPPLRLLRAPFSDAQWQARGGHSPTLRGLQRVPQVLLRFAGASGPRALSARVRPGEPSAPPRPALSRAPGSLPPRLSRCSRPRAWTPRGALLASHPARCVSISALSVGIRFWKHGARPRLDAPSVLGSVLSLPLECVW